MSLICAYVYARTKTPKSGIHAVRSVCGRHDHNMNALFQAVHQGEQLRDDPPLNLTVSLPTWHNHQSSDKHQTVHSYITYLSLSLLLTFSRFGAIASSSSMKMIAGAFFSASSKAFLRLLSDSPASLLMISGPKIQKQQYKAQEMHHQKSIKPWKYIIKSCNHVLNIGGTMILEGVLFIYLFFVRFLLLLKGIK